MLSPDLSDDGPWNEAQWEAFMERQDIRSAKFGELFETFLDHPERDQIIAREMGWFRDEPPDEEQQRLDDELIEEMNRAAAEYEALSDEEKEVLHQQEHEEIEAIPAYHAAHEFGLRVHHALQPFVREMCEEDPDEELLVAFGDSLVIAAKLVAGHAMGYEDDSLCGNIVNCKRALRAADRCLAAMRALRDRGAVEHQLIQSLLEEATQVRDLVRARITELRSRVWWE